MTLVITNYNRQQELDNALASTINQKYLNEIIIVDDASTIPASINIPIDCHVKLVRHDHNQGISVARNTGLSLVKTDYIAYLDDDDKLLPNAFMPHLRVFDKLNDLDKESTVVVGAVLVERGDKITRSITPPSSKPGQIWGLDSFLLQKFSQNFFCKQAALYPTQLLRSLNGWDENLRSRATSEIFLRICEKYTVIGIDDPTYILNRDSKPRITNNKNVRRISFRYLIIKHKRLLKERKRFKYFLNTHLENLYRRKHFMRKFFVFANDAYYTILIKISK